MYRRQFQGFLSRTLRLLCFTACLATASAVAARAEAQAAPTVTIQAPNPQLIWKGTVSVKATVTSTIAVTSVQVQVEDGTPVAMVLGGSGQYTADVSLTSAPHGQITLTVTAVDQLSHAGSASIQLQHDEPPTLQVDLPLAVPNSEIVVQGSLTLSVTCHDDDACVEVKAFEVSFDNVRRQIAAGTDHVDGVFPLQDDTRTIAIQGKDTHGFVTSTDVTINNLSSPLWHEVVSRPGCFIVALDGERSACIENGKKLYIDNWSTGQRTLVDTSDELASTTTAILTPTGVIYARRNSGVMEYRSGQLTVLASGASVVVGKGNYVVWGNGGDAYRYDVIHQTTAHVTNGTADYQFDVASNGDVVYQRASSGRIYRYRAGVTVQLSVDGRTNYRPITDGNQVAYYDNAIFQYADHTDSVYSVKLVENAGAPIALSQDVHYINETQQHGATYYLAPGRAAFQVTEAEVWLRDANGLISRRGLGIAKPGLRAMDDAGGVMVADISDHYRVYYDDGTSALLDLGLGFTVLKFAAGHWYTVVQGNVYRLDSVGSTLDGGVGGETDAGSGGSDADAGGTGEVDAGHGGTMDAGHAIPDAGGMIASDAGAMMGGGADASTAPGDGDGDAGAAASGDGGSGSMQDGGRSGSGGAGHVRCDVQHGRPNASSFGWLLLSAAVVAGAKRRGRRRASVDAG
jgi:hypothetical protein